MRASANNDAGGNSVKVTVDNFAHKTKDELLGFRRWIDAIRGLADVWATCLILRDWPNSDAGPVEIPQCVRLFR